MRTVIRRGEPGDLAAVAAIEAASPQAAQWDVADYLRYDFRVAVCQGRVAGYLVARPLAADGGTEYELLNLAVAPQFRRRGVARGLMQALVTAPAVIVYLEVRESNRAARDLYKSVGFQEVNIRRDYYQAPPEAAIVMKFYSC